ncbi:MAG: pyridoxine 5'-phosphate synthase [Gammaproteobacteria bacterium]|nr:pyridoxine 5'-phosphate synthase [Gammaproteobacteria bacterium]
MTALSVNLNKIALLRNSRPGNYPDVVAHGAVCLAAGAAGITVHPRPDQRHIRPDDVRALAALVATHPGREFNIEGNPFAPAGGGYPGLLALVAETRPQQCTLVPDGANQLTSDHGFDLARDGAALAPVIAQLRAWGVRVSLFMDPEPAQIERAAALGAARIELYTGPYAAACLEGMGSTALLPYRQAAARAAALGLGVNAGHDLNLDNLPGFAAALPQLLEVSIGHALIVDALAMGLSRAVTAYRQCLD